MKTRTSKKYLKKLLKKYNLDINQVKATSEELAENNWKSIDNLVYFTLDIAADNFKLAVIEYVEKNKIIEETGLSCISKIDVHIKNGKFKKLLKKVDVVDFSDENIIAFIEKFKKKNTKK